MPPDLLYWRSYTHDVNRQIRMFLLSSFILCSLLLIDNTVCEYPGPQCAYYAKDACVSEQDETCKQHTTCDPAPNRKSYCMAQWRNTSGIIQLIRKGCWAEDSRCEGRSGNGCYEDRYNPDTYFCCCEGDFCNENFSYQPSRNITAEEADSDKTLRCEYINTFKCVHESPEYCNRTHEYCSTANYGTDVYCYSLAENITGNLVFTKKGCWYSDHECKSTACVSDSETAPYFCCCSESMCNTDMHFIPSDTTTEVGVTEEPAEKNELFMTLFYSLVPMFVLALLVVFTFYCWRRHKSPFHEPLPTVDPSPVPPASPQLPLRSIQLMEVKARGRYGCVWKASMGNKLIAVKIFPLQDRQSYLTEKEIYQVPHMTSHANILTFIGGETRCDNFNNTELWLLTEYHEKGSLYDYLKGNTVTWGEALRIAESITTGLAFLHEALSPYRHANNQNPTIVHRDFKSKNVLIKDNLEACIADFGLALKCEPGKHIGDTHGQVGTRRYMAPEVLEGSIIFSSDSFLRIDMYACGLVLWEVVSRCSSIDGPVDEYQLPFEDMVGLHPTLEDMQDVVSHKKKRPPIREHWLTHEGMLTLCQSIQECWDADPEARLSAGCIQERITQLSQAIAPTLGANVDPQAAILSTANSPQDPELGSTVALAV